MTDQAGLSIVVFSGGFDRVHYALAMAAAAAAVNRDAVLFFTGRALRALVHVEKTGGVGLPVGFAARDRTRPAERDRFFAAHGMATFEELLEACVALRVRILACEMGLRALGLPPSAKLRADAAAEIAGIVTYLAASKGAQTLFV